MSPISSERAQPQLRSIANLWTLWDHPTREAEWSLETKLAAVKTAGFDGITDRADRRLGQLADRHGLILIGFATPKTPGEIDDLVQRNAEAGVRRINVHLGHDRTTKRDALEMCVRLTAAADDYGVGCDFETHRGTCTETPEKTYALARAYRRATGRVLPLTWDFSHFAVVKHLEAPAWDHLFTEPKLIRRARQFHFRPFNGHHCQIPVSDGAGHLTNECEQWMAIVRRTFAIWCSGPKAREVFVCPEIGPVRGGYSLATSPESWNDAVLLRGIVEQAWRGTLESNSPQQTASNRAEVDRARHAKISGLRYQKNQRIGG